MIAIHLGIRPAADRLAAFLLGRRYPSRSFLASGQASAADRIRWSRQDTPLVGPIKPLVAVTVFCAFFSLPAAAQDEIEKENLVDLREVNVVVEELAQDAAAAGLDRRAIQAAVEQRLEERGVPLGNSRSAADLYVNIDTFRGSTGLYAYCVEVSIQQLVTIESNQLRTLADVWQLASLGTVGAGNLPGVEGIVMQIVDVFVEDYLETNPPPE